MGDAFSGGQRVVRTAERAGLLFGVSCKRLTEQRLTARMLVDVMRVMPAGMAIIFGCDGTALAAESEVLSQNIWHAS